MLRAVMVAGEITTSEYVDIPQVVRDTIIDIGYTDANFGIDGHTCGVVTSIQEQSPDIARGVDDALEHREGHSADELDALGAGDQGMMFGFACRETEELMPLPIALAHRLAKRLADVRKAGVVPYLRPDGKSQVSIEYQGGVPTRVDTVLLSAQHREEVDVETLLAPDMRAEVIDPVLREHEIDADDVRVLVNPTGRRRTWRGSSPRTSSRRASPTVSRSRSRMRSARLIPCPSRSTPSGPSRSTPIASSTSFGRRSTSGRGRSSATSIFVGRSIARPPRTAISGGRSSRGSRPIARMISAARSGNAVDAPERSVDILSGPVAICVDRPVLSLDRPFTYELDGDLGGGVGSLVQVPFHGRLVRGWVLGRTDDVPERMLRVRRVVSPVRQFDASMLELCRWVSGRYVAPLASVIVRSHPPRVASEDSPPGVAYDAPHVDVRSDVLAGYANGDALAAALRDGTGTFVVRNAPGEEAAIAVDCIAGACAAGRTAILIVPEVDPMPATVAAVLDAFGEGVACFFGGDKRSRYRMWLDIPHGRDPGVVGTRSTVFAPLRDLGVVVVSREQHVLHREERSPYFHVREVAAARARIHLATCVLLSLMPSLEALALDHVDIEPRERTWPPVEAVKHLGALGLDLVGILNADVSLRRPGIAARERALSTWAEVAAWAAPNGRVIVQTTHPNDPAVQALVVGKPDRFARTERTRLEEAGFPVGAPVFRVVGGVELEAELGALPHRTMLISSDGEHTLCLVALDPSDLRAFGDGVRRLAERGIVSRVEAEPHL